ERGAPPAGATLSLSPGSLFHGSGIAHLLTRFDHQPHAVAVPDLPHGAATERGRTPSAPEDEVSVSGLRLCTRGGRVHRFARVDATARRRPFTLADSLKTPGLRSWAVR